MIKFERTQVFNIYGAIHGMRNPLDSWSKSDSGYCLDTGKTCNDCPLDGNGCDFTCYVIGSNDMALAKRLVKSGTDHRKFLRQIIVNVDITAPLYWWKEFDTYKVGTVANSTSTMHKIHAKEFMLDDFSHEHIINDYQYNSDDYRREWLECMLHTIVMLNNARDKYLQTKDKKYWWQMIQLLPSSYNQTRTVTINYEVLHNIYGSRKNHKLDEWSKGFTDWIDKLPYANEFIKE